MGVTYSATLYDGKTLKQATRVYLAALPAEVTGLLSQGSSGAAIASGMLTLSRRRLTHCAVRKDGENGHQNSCAGIFDRGKTYAIVDDFIDSGRTVRNLVRWSDARNLKVVIILVGHTSGKDFGIPAIALDDKIRSY